MSYNGYLVKLGSNTVNNLIIVPGSYQCSQERVVAGSWRDANGTMHYSFFPDNKATISFTIQPRTMEQHSSIRHLFATLDNINVTYWDDTEEDYKTGVFKMDDPVFKHQYDNNDAMYYAETQIVLKEY